MFSRLLNRLSITHAAFTGATPAKMVLHKDNIRVVQIASVTVLSVCALLAHLTYVTVKAAENTSGLKELRSEITKEMQDSERRLSSEMSSMCIALSSLLQSRPNTTKLPPIKKEQN